jgi:hypothetical protein
MFFFLQEFKANKVYRAKAPLKLPVDGLALLLPEPEYERHPVRTCRWRNIAMLFFLQECKANKGSRETAPLKLPVDGLALLLPEPEYERHPVRTCRWRNIARQPWLCSKQKQNFNDTFYKVQSRM